MCVGLRLLCRVDQWDVQDGSSKLEQRKRCKDARAAADAHVVCVMCCPLCPSGDVIELKVPAGKTFSKEELTQALEQHKPAVLFLCQVRTTGGCVC